MYLQEYMEATHEEITMIGVSMTNMLWIWYGWKMSNVCFNPVLLLMLMHKYSILKPYYRKPYYLNNFKLNKLHLQILILSAGLRLKAHNPAGLSETLSAHYLPKPTANCSPMSPAHSSVTSFSQNIFMTNDAIQSQRIETDGVWNVSNVMLVFVYKE